MKSIGQIRRQRLWELVKAHDDGSPEGLTVRMGWKAKSPGLALRYLKEGRGDSKDLGTALAREIERKYGVEENYLDNLPGTGLSGPAAKLLEMYGRLSPDGRIRLLGQALHMLEAESERRGAGQAHEHFPATVHDEDLLERSRPEPKKRKSPTTR